MENVKIELIIEILLEEYKAVSEEVRIYIKELIKCFVYTGILIALYLGWGIPDKTQTNSFSITIREYIPYGFIILCVYFLSIAYMRVSLMRYRANLENRINHIIGKKLMKFDSHYVPKVQSKGFLKVGESWYARIPTPMLLLAFLIVISGFLVFSIQIIRQQEIIILSLIGFCGLISIYVFLIFPKLVDRTSKYTEGDNQN